MGVPKAKSAQKPRFCARKTRKCGFRSQKKHKNPNFVLEMPENEGSRPQKRTKMPILCSGMVAASPAAPTGAQHYPPRALRGASGSSTPGNKLPQPTTQPAAKTYLPLILPCIPLDNLPAAHTTVHTAVALPLRNYPRACRRGILPCSGSRAQRAGDSDVGANDKGAGDDPGDWVDAH